MLGRILLGAAALAAFSAVAAAAPPDLAPFAAQAITPQVHLLSTPEDYFGPVIGNVTVIEQSDGFVVIDSGLTAANGRAVVAHVKSRSSKPIKAVAITHWHNDHPQGVSAIRGAFPKVRIIATSATEAGMLGAEAFDVGYAPDQRFDDAMTKQLVEVDANLQKLLADPATAPDRRERVKKAIVDYRAFPASFRGTYIVPPTETFERELVIDDPDVPVRLLHLGRANTPGDALAWLPKQKIVVTGDIVVAPTPFGFFSYPGDWIETIGKLKALGFATLIPGHGGPQTDSAYLDKLVAAIADVRAQVGPLAKQGLPLEEVRKKVDFTKSIDFFGTTPRVRANAQSLFFDPMIPNAYKEARGEPIIQGEGNPKPAYSHAPPKPRSIKHPN
jgi:glyoxylase-like metal-dependent hydrolase (beta-lactamase superfamily II)